jgi:hypothetical protein
MDVNQEQQEQQQQTQPQYDQQQQQYDQPLFDNGYHMDHADPNVDPNSNNMFSNYLKPSIVITPPRYTSFNTSEYQ